MKKVSIITAIIIMLIASTGISYILYRNGLLTKAQRESYKENEKALEALMTLGLEGKADQASEGFSKKISEKTGLIVDAENIASTGSRIVSGNFAFTVTSWSVSKAAGYAIPEGEDLSQWGLQLDENGNITNNFSYVVVNITAENMSDQSLITDFDGFDWQRFHLQIFDQEDYVGSMIFLGEPSPRENTKAYFHETFELGETKEIALIFYAPDEILPEEEMYLLYNPLGSVAIEAMDPGILRFIILN